jgi:5-formyltetrahydrofolate cyclo-ligase
MTRRVLNDPVFLSARHIGFYMASDGELDPAQLLTNAHILGKKCYLPLVSDQLLRWRKSPLLFQQFEPLSDQLARNRYGILEPCYDPHRIIAVEMLDILFLPLVGFDRAGNRIGMGAGFYDRSLSGLERRFHRPRLVGLGYSFQEVEKIEPDDWDIPLDAVVTEDESFCVR